MKICFIGLILSLVTATTSFAKPPNPLSVAKPEADNSVEAEQKSFTLAEGYAVNLFADETDGIANPVCMSWDAAGRLWVLCSWAYPQIKPIKKPNDKLLILEDTNGDGRADKTTVFADGLNMPTGFAIGHGGAYIGQGNDLLLLQDTNGDSKADKRRVLLTGFGTGDTHQNINSFTWSPGGELLFCQGLHSFSRVETPWGISRLDEHGSWRLRPKRLQLQGFRRTSGGGNPWGINFGNWGEPFVKSNGTGICELLPNMVSTQHTASFWGGKMKIGDTQIKSMIIEFAESPHLPKEIQGDMLIAGYFAHNIDRFRWKTDGAGHKLKNMPSLLTSSHNAFRPVDIRVGPDGAIYIADWFNPIIGHYQASFRHPDRDKTHGRIWRVTAKGHPLAKAPALMKMNATELCEQLKSDWRYVRYQAKRRLMDLPKQQVIPAIKNWITNLKRTDSKLEHHLYEAIGVFESHEVVNLPLLQRLLKAKDYRARAYATRVVGRWHDRLDAPLDLLDKSVTDKSPRVRLEAIVACSDIQTPASMVIAAKSASQSMDRFIGHALTQTVHALAAKWRPALQQGKLSFNNTKDLIFVLQAYGSKDVAGDVRGLIRSKTISEKGRRQLLQLLARVGNATDLSTVFDHATRDPQLLQSLPAIAMLRRIKPAGNVHNKLVTLLASRNTSFRSAAARLAGLWKQKKLVPSLKSILKNDDNDTIRAAAIRSLAELEPQSAVKQFQPLISNKQTSTIYLAALEAVSQQDVNIAATTGLEMLTTFDDAQLFAPVLNTIMHRRGANEAVIHALKEVEISSDDAKLISRWMSASGQDNVILVRRLTTLMGIKPGKSIPYNASFVQVLAKEVRQSGNITAGKKVFQSSVTNCIACHKVKGIDQKNNLFQKGPELSAVGAGLQLELIIESVIWPKRQIKEGFELTTILTLDGRQFSGYLTSENNGTIGIRDLATGQVREIPVKSIDERIKKGTAMPTGFTNALTREELRDLIAWLASLKV